MLTQLPAELGNITSCCGDIMCTDCNIPREDIQAEKADHSPPPQGNGDSKATTCSSVLGSISHKFEEIVKRK